MNVSAPRMFSLPVLGLIAALTVTATASAADLSSARRGKAFVGRRMIVPALEPTPPKLLFDDGYYDISPETGTFSNKFKRQAWSCLSKMNKHLFSPSEILFSPIFAVAVLHIKLKNDNKFSSSFENLANQ